jgi:serine/threonine protein kinase
MASVTHIRNKYEIMGILGNGKFGTVFKGQNIKTNMKVAIKFENKGMDNGLLKHETLLLNYLHVNHCKYIPLVHWYGNHELKPCLVMSYYTISLSQYIESNTTINVLSIIQKMLTIIESVHKLSILHRDIKPDNFMFDNNDELFLIDFGISTFFIKDEKIKKETDEITGNILYASPDIHAFFFNRRIDDIIAIAYIGLLIYRNGRLPWMNIDDTNDEKMKQIINLKKIENIYLEDRVLFRFIKNLYQGKRIYNYKMQNNER